MQTCLKITNGSYNLLTNLGFFAVIVVTLPMPDEQTLYHQSVIND